MSYQNYYQNEGANSKNSSNNNRYRYQSNTNTNNNLTSSSSFKLVNTSNPSRSVLQTSMQSASKLDELLSRCRQIGVSSGSPSNQPPVVQPRSQTAPVTRPPPPLNISSSSTNSIINNNYNNLRTISNPYRLDSTKSTFTKVNNAKISTSIATNSKQSHSQVLPARSQLSFRSAISNLPVSAVESSKINKFNHHHHHHHHQGNIYSLNNTKTSIPFAPKIQHQLAQTFNRHFPKLKRARIKSATIYSIRKWTTTPSTTTTRNNRNNDEPPVLDINMFLGRRVSDVSKSRFKFIKRKPTSASTSSSIRKRSHILTVNRFKVDNKKSDSLKSIRLGRLKTTLTTTAVFNRNTRRAAAAAVYTFHATSKMTPTSMTSIYRLTNKRSSLPIVANNLINRSKMTINRTKQQQQPSTSKNNNNKVLINNKNKQQPSEKKYCLFFNRFGRCSRGDKCPYVHDKTRVALCPRFLRGTCQLENCPYSHTTSPEKTPLCSFFAAGCCNRENCPYSHIYLGKDVEFCVEFAKGYCPLGAQCTKAHINECPEHEQGKKCPRGKKCPFVHRNHQKSKGKGEKIVVVRKVEEKEADSSEFGDSFISFRGEAKSGAETTENKDCEANKQTTILVFEEEAKASVESKPDELKIRPKLMAKSTTRQ